jgi:hypothetical protein
MCQEICKSCEGGIAPTRREIGAMNIETGASIGHTIGCAVGNKEWC